MIRDAEQQGDRRTDTEEVAEMAALAPRLPPPTGVGAARNHTAESPLTTAAVTSTFKVKLVKTGCGGVDA